METKHPYNFVAKQCIIELLESEGAAEKTMPLLPRLIGPMRKALSSRNKAIFMNGLGTLRLLSNVIQDGLNPHINKFIGQLGKRMNNK